jgi:prepilin-type N-terminal cleavage/methylation domain-containing protein
MKTIRGQAGYGLVEMLVAVAIVGFVLAAVFVALDVSQRSFTSASALADAQVGARVAIDRMVAELRLIGSSYRGATGAGAAISAATATSITFIGDIDADSVAGNADAVATGTSTGTTIVLSVANSGFTVNESAYIANGGTREVRPIGGVAGATLTLDTALSGTYPAGSIVRSVETVTYTYDATTKTLTRTAGSSTETTAENLVGFTLTYFDGSNPPVQTTDLTQIREIEVKVTIEGTGGTAGSRRVLTARVRPRSLAL